MILGVWWLLVQRFGLISGTGIAWLVYLAGLVILDDRLSRREMRRFDQMDGGFA